MFYTVKYLVVDPHLINNKLAPTTEHILKEENERRFYTKLEKSILEQGFRNPINVWSLPEGTEPRYGGSRLYVAQKYNIPVPCIISDHCDRFPDGEILTGVKEIYNKFVDPPRKIYYTKRGVNMSGCEHMHLKE